MKTLKTVAVCALVVAAFCFGKAAAEFPQLSAAKKSLIEAKNHLQMAKRDFGGHRAKAAEAVDKAVKEVDEAILYGDKKKD
ncbi:MAG: hypothetical protein JST48_10570 [Bacteroidetes bacterium]|nr:hypothetical protein [Bacteroidota bacterium]